MIEGKWITGVPFAMPTVEAAGIVLGQRLHAVVAAIPPARDHAAEDVEHVHQLRVATRRANAALMLFEVCLPNKLGRATKQNLRDIRRAAGDARDWDVFPMLPTITRTLQNEAYQPVRDFLFGFTTAKRMEAQTVLVEVLATKDEVFSKRTTNLLEDLKEPRKREGVPQLGDLAVTTLNRLMTEFREADAKAPQTYEELHQVRILGKRVRYAMEVFSDCFAPEFRTALYPLLESIQETLGSLADHHLAEQRIRAISEHLRAFFPQQWPAWEKGIAALVRNTHRRMVADRKQFDTQRPQREAIFNRFPLEQLVLQPPPDSAI